MYFIKSCIYYCYYNLYDVFIYLSFSALNNEFVPCMDPCVQAISYVILVIILAE